jgi:hypothetical protein
MIRARSAVAKIPPNGASCRNAAPASVFSSNRPRSCGQGKSSSIAHFVCIRAFDQRPTFSRMRAWRLGCVSIS